MGDCNNILYATAFAKTENKSRRQCTHGAGGPMDWVLATRQAAVGAADEAMARLRLHRTLFNSHRLMWKQGLVVRSGVK